MIWARLAYSNAEGYAIRQFSIYQHYKSTFETYGSLISPLILLKAVMYEFPLVTMEKEFNGMKHVLKGIRLREIQSQFSSITGEERTEVTTCPRLAEVALDAEILSAEVMEDAGTPIWKGMEDSQGGPPSHAPEENVYAECTFLRSRVSEPLPPVSENSTGQTQPVQATSPLSRHEMQLADVRNMRSPVSDESNANHSLVVEHTSGPPQVLSLSSSCPEMVYDDLQPNTSTASTDVTLVDCEEIPVVMRREEGHGERCNILGTEESPAPEVSEQLHRSQVKRTRQGSHSSVPMKKTKTDDEQSLATVDVDGNSTIQQGLELDEDTIVVACRPITQINSRTDAISQSLGRGKEISTSTKYPSDSSASSLARKHREPSPPTDYRTTTASDLRLTRLILDCAYFERQQAAFHGVTVVK